MRYAVAALCCATVMGLHGCGGGGGGGQPGNAELAPAPQLRISAAADDSGRAPSGVVHAHRIEVRNTGNATARAVVVSTTLDAQALQLPLSCESTGCTQRSDGGVEIAEVAAGGTVVIRQQLRVKPGHRGAVRNDWQASTAGNSANWRQELTAYVADVAVTVGEAVTAEANPLRRNYEVTLVNHGPDDASDVEWRLLTVPDQMWRTTSCTASAGSACPAGLGEAMTLARLPAGGTIRLSVQVNESDPDSILKGIASRAEAAGDPDPRNNAAARDQSAFAHLFMSDLEGRHYRLTVAAFNALRAVAPGVDYRTPVHFDVTGQGFLGEWGSHDAPWRQGMFSSFGPIMVLGLDIGGVRKPYLAPRQLVSELSELERWTFNVLGSRADATGKPQHAYTGSARFKDGALQLCLAEAQLPFDQCPAAHLTRYEAAVVGAEIELLSRDRVVRIRAARNSEGPILISSSRDSATGASEFWIALPTPARPGFSGFGGGLQETTFESASGHSTAVLGALLDWPSGNLRITPNARGVPNAMLLRLSETGLLGICGVEAQLSPTAQPDLFQGELRGDWLPGESVDGQLKKEHACFAGPVHHAQTDSFAVVLGAKGGDLMGRWMLVTPEYF